ncbi:MAG TPA: FAD-dependent oxidoreductase [Trinickia sp.]|uniref:NAD(P)/FAD-dependent oxidoreductase n=1 Tax=Trinickia sp. TaxID=2571163 RepID=UPI002C08FE88|nr:FAD-dependent oxidoreductase [Trinickia sp.]HVW53747.1 FAD-dependent oxidoreductase [Trinickia sp.]
MRETADIVVIGGGTTGCAIAWHLAHGGLRVRLVERTRIGAGSSGASPGIVRQYYADSALAILAREGLDTYRHWPEIVGGDCGYRRTGFLTAIAASDEQAIRAHVRSLQAMGIELQWMPAEALRSRYRDVALDDLAGAVFEPNAGYCDASATALTYAAGARSRGAAIDIGRAAWRIVTDGGRVSGVETDRGRIDCGIVVNAAGPWAAALAKDCGAALPITASRQCVAIVQVEDDAGEALPGLSDRRAGFYLRPDVPGRYFIGSLHADDAAPADPDRSACSMSDADAVRYRNRAALRFSRLTDAVPVDSRVSFFDDTPDGNPLFGPDPRVQGLFVAAGLSGHGFKFAPLFGRAVSDWISTGAVCQRMSAFKVERVLA